MNKPIKFRTENLMFADLLIDREIRKNSFYFVSLVVVPISADWQFLFLRHENKNV